ncbi:BtrH N-terminal domain-containing protein [Amycolatopsis sp. K13G38]|uniref:BtrH N-terminal domain-containing protein n=2 Tax=Amycolatopsis acididurans TaxID=2724524 RepID=A0ABX1JG34_9PSEU|nr:BtrH N-terminal domain-containing protein [Amycolatopsis acididurans]
MGGHCGSGALRDLMQWHGLGWDRPPTEGLVFALGGALDFSYVRSAALVPPVYLVGRGGDLELDLIRRLGGRAALRATDDPQAGWQHVRDELDAGRPVLAWADIAELPYLRVRLRMSRHDIVLIGYDDDRQLVHVVDNDRVDTQLVPYDALARARASTSFPEPTRHTTYDITWPAALPDLGDALADAFRRSADAMTATSPSIFGTTIAGSGYAGAAASGLAGVALFAEDFCRWPDLFDDTALDVALRSLGAFVEKAGTGGGLFRKLLADGAHDANLRLHDSAVDQVAAAAADAAATWSAAAAAAASSAGLRQRHAAAAEHVQQVTDYETTLRDRLAHAAAVLTKDDAAPPA